MREIWHVEEDMHPDVTKTKGFVSVHTSPSGWAHWQDSINERIRMDRREAITWALGILSTAFCIAFVAYLIYQNGQSGWEVEATRYEAELVKQTAAAELCRQVIDSEQSQVIIDNTC